MLCMLAKASPRTQMWILSAPRLCCYIEQLLIVEMYRCHAALVTLMPAFSLLLGCLCSALPSNSESFAAAASARSDTAAGQKIGRNGRGEGACRVHEIKWMGFGSVNKFTGRMWHSIAQSRGSPRRGL